MPALRFPPIAVISESQIDNDAHKLPGPEPRPGPEKAPRAHNEAFPPDPIVTFPHELHCNPEEPAASAAMKLSPDRKIEAEHESHTNGDGAVILTF
jgi:hypothetical protein